MSRLSRHFRSRLFLLIGLLVILGVSAPRPAAAILGFGDTSITVADIPRYITEAISKGLDKLKSNIKIATDIAFKNSVKAFVARTTQEVSTQLSAAGPGQKPLFLQNPRTFFRNAANSAATDFIDNFSRGVTGQTGPGGAFSSTRARFIISRSLRTAIGSPVEQCRQDCRDSFSVTKVYGPNFTGPKQQQNSYETAISLVLSQMEAVGGTLEIASVTPDKDMNCQYVVPIPSTGGAPQWDIISTANNGLQIPAQECLRIQREAINTARSASQKEVNQCLKDCQNGVVGATQRAIQAATARDVFTAIKDIDPANAPAALSNALSRDTSDFGQLISASSRLVVAVQDRVTGEDTRLRPQVIARESRVSGETLAPPEVVTSTLTGLPLNGQSGETTYTGTGAADVLKGIAAFLNSPVGKALANYFKSKCGLNPDACKGPSNAQSSIGQLLFGSGNPTGLAGAQIQFASLGRVDFITGDPGRNEISITDQLTSSGLIDAQFRSAIEEEVTVQQALDKKLLDSRKTFGFDKNGIQPTNGYPYRALQYLRKFRVIPVGWELAAKFSQQFDQRDLSLGFLVGQYDMCAQTTQTCSNIPSRVCSADANCLCSANDVNAGLCTGAGTTGSCGFTSREGSTSVCSNELTKTCIADTDCNGGTCGASPYCGLVDPNWVLKAPQTYCRRQGAGEEILTKEFICDQNNIDRSNGDVIDPNKPPDTDNLPPNCVKSTNNQNPDIGRWVISRNADTCADIQSCIAENEDGTCVAYGYCVQEKDTYKFDGTQCSEENGTCTTYVNEQGQEATYLANTLDFQNCTADNAGCQWYCKEYDTVAGRWTCTERDAKKVCSNDGTRACDADADCTGGGLCVQSSKTINFTESAASCSATEAGCRRFIRTGNGTNLLPNGGFESFTGGALDGPLTAVFTGWSTVGQIDAYPVTPTDSAITGNNGAAVRIGGSGSLTQTHVTAGALNERTFVGSIRAKAGSACNASLTVSTLAGSTTTTMAVTPTWTTFSATVTIPTAAAAANSNVTFTITPDGCASSGLNVDSAQLEEGGLTNYKDYGAINLVYLNGTRQQCQPEDVGCQRYTPVNRGPAVTGVVRDSNRCSADKVGCATYTLEPITSVPLRSGGPTNIIPTKARTCSAADVGCEEYTNLDEVARGGEGKAYFKSIKQCVKPVQTNASNPIQETYYTWVGDAQRGFVLRAYNLIRSNYVAAEPGAPCTKLSLGNAASSPTCIDDAASVAAAKQACSSAADLITNANCAEYYNAGLTAFYRLRSSTISVTEDCRPFRNTIDSENNIDLIYNLSPKENIACGAAAAACRAYTGNAGKTSRQVFTEGFEAGNTANWITANTAPSTESVSLGGHSLRISQTTPAFTLQSVLNGKLAVGKTYTISFIAAAATNTGVPPRLEAYLGNANANTFTYSQPPATDPNQVFLPVGGVATSYNTNITPPGPEWNAFTLGPLNHTNVANNSIGLFARGGDIYVDNIVLTEVNDTLYLVSKSVPICAASDIGCAAYRDGSNQLQYLKSFTRICSEQVVGCQALIDTQNSTTPFAQTIKNVLTPQDSIVTVVNSPGAACRAGAKGCEAFGSPVYSTDRAITSFKTVYLKNDPDRHSQDLCLVEEVFCRAYSIRGGGAAFFKDPGTGVCEFRKGNEGSNGTWYIQGTNIVCPTVNPPASGRPIGASCSPVCTGGDRAGRACLSNADCTGGVCTGDPGNAGKITGPGQPVIGQCTSSSQCTTGTTTNSTITAGQNTCVYLAGLCPEGENGCTEYRDPADPVNCRAECPYTQQGASPVYVDATCTPTVCSGGTNAGQNCQTSDECSGGGSCVGSANTSTTGFPGCRSYFYLRETVEDNAGECNGVVDPKIGCRPFNDTSKDGLNFRGQ